MNATSRLILLAVVCAVLALLAIPRLQLGYNLSAFLPPAQTQAQAILTQHLGQGPGAQLLFVELKNSSALEATQVAERLRAMPGVQRVLPEPFALDMSSLPPAIWQHRLLLTDLPAAKEDWQAVLAARLDDLAFAADDDGLELIAGDPLLASVDTLLQFAQTTTLPAFDQGETQYLIVQTSAEAFDLGAQSQTINKVRSALQDKPHSQLLGSPVYAVDLQSAVRFEATAYSLLASLLLLAAMVYRFRAAYPVIAIALPLLTGGLGGLLALALFYDEVHGITLAFGFTLLGVAIDYPLHLFTHAQYLTANSHTTASGPTPLSLRHNVWPTLRLGIFSTLIAYAAFIFAGSVGLAQLGVFGACGVLSAALAAAWLTPEPLEGRRVSQPPMRVDGNPAQAQHYRYWPGLLLMVLSAMVLQNTTVFNDNLSSLTPVAPEVLQADAQIRRNLGVTDIRYLIAIHTDKLQTTLETTERVYTQLQPLIVQGQLTGIQAITEILPSHATQTRRRQVLATPTSVDIYRSALVDSNFSAQAFAPFEAHWQNMANEPTFLDLQDLQKDAGLQTSLANLIFRSQNNWVSLMYLQGISDQAAIETALADFTSAQLVDLKTTSESLVASYRTQLFSVLGGALLAIIVLLGFAVQLKKTLWLATTVAGAVLWAAAASAILRGGLSLFDLMALTLVAGLGLDYALFYGRQRSTDEEHATASAVFICAASSLIVFGVLSWSSIPVLSGIGATVSFGVVTAYLLSRFGRYTNAGE